jgi:opacity protein-like surface antigen
MKRLLFAALLAAPVAASAENVTDDLYWGASLTQLRYSDDRLADTWKPIGGTLKLGYEATERFAIEGRIGITGEDDRSYDSNVGPIEVALQADYYASVFGRFNVTTGPAKLYLLLGATSVRLSAEATANGVSVGDDETESDLSYGVGLDLYGNRHLAVTVEYIRHLDKSDYYIDAANLGFTYRF